MHANLAGADLNGACLFKANLNEADLRRTSLVRTHEDEQPFGMFADLQAKYHLVLDVLKYDTPDSLIGVLEPAIVRRALAKADDLQRRQAEAQRPACQRV